ncbi:MAG TPA: rhomboid family intramembrane serine protease [Candidatus Polarisedimenticolia bacterium]|nr:rhomboid family intramembrane serine protease [Candidatus Polarisedimenticolia bacterium]
MPSRYDDRPQYRVSFGGAMTPAVKTLILINVAVYVLELFIKGIGGDEPHDLWQSLFALNPVEVFQRFRVWQLVTYMFMHSINGLFHILFNMLVLWMFGSEIERVWGARRFARYYLITGVGAGIVNCAFVMQSRTVGASGAIFGLIVAYAMLFPTRTILFWGIFPMTARQFALLIGAIELITLGAFSPDGVARFAHLGGALTGYILMRGFWDPRSLIADIRWRIRRRRFRTISKRGEGGRDRSYPFH